MRILAIGNRSPASAAGGYERIFAGTVAALEAAGHAVRVLTPPELRWYWRDGGFVRPPWREVVRMERHNAAVLHRALAGMDAVCWWGMGGMSLSLVEHVRRAGVPAIGVVGDGWMVYGPGADRWTAFWRRLPAAPRTVLGIPARLDLGAGARWLFISEAVRARAPATSRAQIARPGVDAAAFPFRSPEAWGWRLACIGRIEPRKGIAVAVEALPALPEATLTVDGPDEGHGAELEALAGRLGVAGRVRFTRTRADRVADAYAAADAVLFPVTWPEPWGLVPLEAMSVGRPVVATGTGGSGEYLRDGENTLLAAPGDAAALAAAVCRLASEATLRDRLVAGGRATAARLTQDAFQRQVIGALEAEAHGVPTPS